MELRIIDRILVHLYLMLYPLFPTALIFRIYRINKHDDQASAIRKYKFLDLLHYHTQKKNRHQPFIHFGYQFLQLHPVWKSHMKGYLQEKKAVSFSEADKLRTLDDVLNILSKHNIRHFLCFGTLLGMIRENSFLAQDIDIDIGIFHDECGADRVFEILSKEGYRSYALKKDPWPCKVQMFHPETGVLCDIIFFKRDEDNFKTFTLLHDHLLVRNRTPFNLVEVPFFHLTVCIPEHPENFLTENYGNWQSVQLYHHHILTSELTDYRLPVVQCLFIKTCIDLLIRQDDHGASTLIQRWNNLLRDRLIQMP